MEDARRHCPKITQRQIFEADLALAGITWADAENIES